MNNTEENVCYARVSDVLKPFANFAHIDPDVLQKAADRGTRVHKYCELYALGLFLPSLDLDCKGYVESYQRWFDAVVDSVSYVELPIVSDAHRLCTKGVDLIATIKGDKEQSIIDLKTPETAARTWRLQLAAYEILAHAQKIFTKRRLILQLSKSGDMAKVIEYADPKDTELFLSALQLHNFFKS